MALTAEDLKANLIFSDGACSGNPGPGDWGAIIVRPTGEVQELGGGAAATTNNQMEMMGTIAALEALRDAPEKVLVFTDSTYVIRGITQWVWGWRQRGWLTAEGNPVANRELWERLVRIVAQRPKHATLDWRYVRGHTGVAGNERCDEIAVAFSKRQRVTLFQGLILQYQIPIHDLPDAAGALPEPRPKQQKAAAYSYLSVVDGVPQRHRTWAECERRVKGRSGARFKKATSEADERSILAGWGVRL